MDLDTIKEKLSVHKLIGTKKEMIIVEGDMIVPDSKPDVLNTICTSGVVCVYKKDISEAKIGIGGVINTYIMYQSQDDNDKTRGLNTNIEFMENIKFDEAKEGADLKVIVNIKQIESRVVNERKIAIKANLEIIVEIYSSEEVDIINELNDLDNIQILKDNIKVNSLKGIGNTKVYAKDTISIDNADNLVEILKMDMKIVNRDIKISYNKVLTKAELEVNMMYLTDDMRINKISSNVPLVGFIDLLDIAESDICDMDYEIKNIVIKPNSVEEHSIYIEAEVDIKLVAYEEKEMNLIKDVYSPIESIEYTTKNIKTITEKTTNSELKQVREKIDLDIFANQKIIDVDVIANVINQVYSNNEINYECELELKFMITNESMENSYKSIKLGFDYKVINNIDNKLDKDLLNNELVIDVVNKDFMIQDGGIVNTNIDLMMISNLVKTESINVINQIESTGERLKEDYSVVIYIIKEGDTLWNIAKEFGSTVDDIQRINGIEDEKNLQIGEKIFIPKYNKRGVTSNKSNMISYV